MRLLNANTLMFEEFAEDIPEYTILSHRWQQEEVSFKDFELNRHHTLKGFAKIEARCRLTLSQGYQYTWIDTCCIDKSSSAELTEAINSMYRWYQNSQECYAYLCDVMATSLETSQAQEEFRSSVWFTRGWTLQELIAPEEVLFLNDQWQGLGRKSDIDYLLEKITTIDTDVLCHRTHLLECSIAQRMSWAASRTTTRIEDRAYSLLGIFDVNMPMLYGEGNNAFRRLQEEIIKRSDDQSIFSWTNTQETNKQKLILAPNLSCFYGTGSLRCIYPTNDDRTGYALTNAGLSIKLMLIPWTMNIYLAPLSCGIIGNTDTHQKPSIRGYDRICIFLQQTEHNLHLIRTSVNGADSVKINSDQIAGIRDAFKLRNSAVFLRQSISSLPEPAFYGFEFVFRHFTLFQSQKRHLPRMSDVICGNVWNVANPLFEVRGPGFHAAGIFRLNVQTKDIKVLFIYFGFDLSFAPVCLISTQTPPVPAGSKCDLKHDDLSNIDEGLKFRLLNLPWLLKQVAKGKDTDNLVAFRADRSASADVICRRLSLKVSFDLEYSPKLKKKRWSVCFHSWEAPKSQANIWHSFSKNEEEEDDVTVEYFETQRVTAITHREAGSNPYLRTVTEDRVAIRPALPPLTRDQVSSRPNVPSVSSPVPPVPPVPSEWRDCI